MKFMGMTIRVSEDVPKGEIWFAKESKPELRFDGPEVRFVTSLKVLAKIVGIQHD